MDAENLGIEISIDIKHKKLLKECYEYSKKSNHPSTHNAALIVTGDEVLLGGVNRLPPGVLEKKERFDGLNKHVYLNHAERDAVYRAAREGVKTDGLTMVMPWLPCINCANAVISAGFRELIVHKQMIERTKESWKVELKNALELLNEAGVSIVAYDGPVGATAYMHSQEWDA